MLPKRKAIKTKEEGSIAEIEGRRRRSQDPRSEHRAGEVRKGAEIN